jgi:hypothetical protein
MSGFIPMTIVSPDQMRMVFPLAREVIPGLELKAWLSFARGITNLRRAAAGGVVAVRRVRRPLPCGMFIYRREKDPAHGSILIAEHFVALDVLDSKPVVDALTSELDHLAHRLGCGAIRAIVLDQGSVVESGLRDAGLLARGATLWKQIPHAPGDDGSTH